MKLHIERTNTALNGLLPLAMAVVCTVGFYDSSIAQGNKSTISGNPHSTACSFQTDEGKGGGITPLTTTFVEMTKPAGGYPTITDMAVFNSKLYLTTSKDPLGDWGANVFYTTDGNSYTKVLEDNTSQGFLRMGVYDSKLWIPDSDPNGMDPTYVYISSTGASGSFTKTSIPGAVHTFDIAKHGTNVYASNGMGTSEGGMSKYDGANSWPTSYSSATAFRMKYMAEFQGKLYVANDNPNSDVDYFVWSGDVATTTPTQKNTATGVSMTFRWFASSQGKLFWSVVYGSKAHCLVSTDGNTWTPVAGLDGTFVSDYCELNGKMYALSQNGLWESSDYMTFVNIAPAPASDPNAFKPVPMTGGYNSDGNASMEAFNGAIWCGSSTNGKVYKVDVATSVHENTQGLAFDRISPNPFTSSASFQTTKPMENATMTIYSSLGQVVKIIKNINGSSFTFDRDELPNGLYYVQLSQNNITIASDKMIITD
jgi:hypothetical protein